ncbi:MAG TPA: helix-turn-helix domain-containing protein [Candidatus Nanoarchaeia archaeon]|nr:helix-turn-helix domain-containing protein [Candidatus Nanoarchaeia archaeon]
MLFQSNKIKEGEDTVAEKLRAAREEKKITLEAAAKNLAIKIDYLTALEKGDQSALPAGVYAKTFLRQYAAFLGLNARQLLFKYQKEISHGTAEKKDVFAKKKINKSQLLIFPRILKNVLLLVIAVIFLSYLGYYLLKTFSSPRVEIFQPADNLVTQNNYVDVIGRADSKTQITINNKQILKDEAGNFQERVDLNRGINTIVISAQNKYGPKKIIEKQILAK